MQISDDFVVYVCGRVGNGLRKRVIHIAMNNAGSNPVRIIPFFKMALYFNFVSH